jgi:hypothetical protein
MLLEKDRRDRQEALKANANPFWARFAEAA